MLSARDLKKAQEHAVILNTPLNRKVFGDGILVTAGPDVNLFLVAEAMGYAGKQMTDLIRENENLRTERDTVIGELNNVRAAYRLDYDREQRPEVGHDQACTCKACPVHLSSRKR
jgi:hypothetical protein